MIKSLLTVLVIAAMSLAGAATSGEKMKTPRIVSDVTVRMASDLIYTELLSEALRKGWRYTPEQIESGYRRHLEEFKLLLIDQGYMIVIGEAGA